LKRAIRTMLKVKTVNKGEEEEEAAIEEESVVEDDMEEASEQAGESRAEQIKHHLCALVDLFFS
jgi:hypothetical protein